MLREILIRIISVVVALIVAAIIVMLVVMFKKWLFETVYYSDMQEWLKYILLR